MVDKKSVRFSASEEPKRKKGWRFRPFRRKESREPAESTNDEHSFPTDKYDKFLEDPNYRSHATAQPRARNKRDFSKRKEVFLSNPPPASQAAFGGPPRYDWIDIVSVATRVKEWMEEDCDSAAGIHATWICLFHHLMHSIYCISAWGLSGNQRGY